MLLTISRGRHLACLHCAAQDILYSASQKFRPWSQAELEALHLEEKEFFSHKASSAPNATDGGGGAKQHAKQVALHKAKGAQIRAAQALEAADKCMLTKILCSVRLCLA